MLKNAEQDVWRRLLGLSQARFEETRDTWLVVGHGSKIDTRSTSRCGDLERSDSMAEPSDCAASFLASANRISPLRKLAHLIDFVIWLPSEITFLDENSIEYGSFIQGT